MLSGIRTKLAHLFKRPKPESEFIRLAQEQGLLTTREVRVAEELIEQNPDDTSQDLLVDEGMLTESEANVVAIRRAEVAPAEHRAEQFKRAHKALDDTGALHLTEVAAAVAGKK